MRLKINGFGIRKSWPAAMRPLIMTDKWFDEYMFRVVAEKKYVPAKVLDILKQKPIRLPAWDQNVKKFTPLNENGDNFILAAP